MNVGLQYPYASELSDTNSKEFKELAVTVIQVLEVIYKNKYGSRLKLIIIIAFRPMTKRAANNTEAEVQLVFNENSTIPIPTGEDVVSVLKNIADNNNTFAVTFDPNAVTLLNQPYSVGVRFRTNGTFVNDFSKIGSDLFTNRTIMIKNGLTPYFIADFRTTFSILTMSNYSNGTDRSLRAANDSILNFMDLAFARSGGNPNITQIAQTIIRAAKNDSLPFKIYLTDIIVNGTVFSSSDVSSKISVLMACFMVAVSLLFTRFS
ncbi:uncharacterized protein LOC113650041 [Tachysurus fulvidraco]|uniref:uncharacterized protein LOC113650041 n=1 Tax=Tachysurus fulvidraco TaxID=1234273 RepID=UPI000F50A50F|nr:uncharacterized protein LOC113650041 [Tachysurus fulvidraco]